VARIVSWLRHRDIAFSVPADVGLLVSLASGVRAYDNGSKLRDLIEAEENEI